MARPPGSKVRQNIVDILAVMKEAYGYQLFRRYISAFPKVTMRSIYYNLQKGVETGELRIARIEQGKGDFSWGPSAQRVFYSLGPKAQPSSGTQGVQRPPS